MLRPIVVIACLACSSGALAQTFDIPPELWDRPRTARSVLDEENIKRAIQLWLAKPDADLVIHHGAGQEPLVQAEELKSWLSALAVDSRRIALRADGAAGAPLKVEVTQ